MRTVLAAAVVCIPIVGVAADAANENAVGPASSTGLEEIVVTAQRREERLQDVPISISVLGGEELDRSTSRNLNEELMRVPGVALDSGGAVSSAGAGTSQLGMRGVTAPGSYAAGGSTVGYYIDSVPFGFVKSAAVPDLNIYDLDRIEVQRGPQGTLYGAGGLAGVVRVLTKNADLENFEFKMRGSGSSTEHGGENYRGDMALNVPLISGKLGARLVAGYEDWSGWIDRPNKPDANDTEASSVRLKLNAQPTDKLSLALSAWMAESDTGNPPAGGTDGNPLFISLADVEERSTEHEIYSLQATYELDPFSLTSSTSYVDFANSADSGQRAVPDGFANFFYLTIAAKTFAQEFSLASTTDGPWRWTAGAIYRDSKDIQLVGSEPVPYPQFFKFTSESWAVFGEITRELFDGRWELTGGLRYFEDDVTTREFSQFSPNPTPPPLIYREASFDATTPRAILTWKPETNKTFYASYSQGFRSGFDQQPSILRQLANNFAPAIEPDKLHNYEIGSKGRLLEGRLSFDVAVYYMDWRDVQQSLSVVFPDNTSRTVGVNGTSASGVGADLALTLTPADGLQISLSGSWNDLSMDEDVRSHPPGAPPEGIILFDKGDRLDNSIELTLGAAIDYSFPIGNQGWIGRLSASANRASSKDFRSLAGAAAVVNRGDDILMSRASFGIDSPKGWSASLFGENLNNEDGALYRNVDVTNAVNAFYPRPRTIGMQVEFRY